MKAKLNIFLSVFCGILVAAPAFVITLLFNSVEMALLSAVLFGAMFALCISIFFGIYMHRVDKKYAEAEKFIKSQIFFKTNGNFDIGKGILNGNIYFCDDGIVFISLNKKAAITEAIALCNIERYDFSFPRMTVYCNDGCICTVMIAELDRARQVLIEKGWIIG